MNMNKHQGLLKQTWCCTAGQACGASLFTPWASRTCSPGGRRTWRWRTVPTGGSSRRWPTENRLPFPLVGLDTDNGGEFINHALIRWAGDRNIFFTRSRPYKSNDNAHVEQKNGDVVRRHAFHYRYDTVVEQNSSMNCIRWCGCG